MLTKIVVLFLVAMMILAVFGRLRLRRPNKRTDKRADKRAALICADCGRPRIGTGRCVCGSDR